MTPGEKMVWAAAYAAEWQARTGEGSAYVVKAATAAAYAVRSLRTARQQARLGFVDDGARDMLDDMLAPELL